MTSTSMRRSETARWVRSAVAVFRKDWHAELRTRYAVNALLMFVVTTIAVIMFSLGAESAPPDALAGMLWVVIFFASMSGLARTFITEEERGTSLTLQLMTTPGAVFVGKLLFNLVLIFALNAVIVILYALFVNGFLIQTVSIFLIALVLGSTGMAVAATVLAAIIARASTKGTLYPVLAFPIMLPLLMAVINATRLASEGALVEEAFGEFQLLISYIVVVVTVSLLLFEYIWKD